MTEITLAGRQRAALEWLPADGSWDRPTPNDPAPTKALIPMCLGPLALVEHRQGWFRLSPLGMSIRKAMTDA